MENKKLRGTKPISAIRSQSQPTGGDNMSEQFAVHCCGQAMRSFGLVDVIGPNIESVRRWACEVCGHGIDLVHFDFDEAELENELELYGDLSSPLHIHQLKRGNG
jgi:hypothetical protein